MNKYIITAPEDISKIPANEYKIAHLAYRISPDLHLLRGKVSAKTNGGLMVVFGQMPPAEDLTHLSFEIYNECLRFNFEGVLFDLDQPNEILCQLLRNMKVEVFVAGKDIISTNIKSGNLKEYLITNHAKAVEIEIINRMLDFETNMETSIEPHKVKSLIDDYNLTTFYSNQLCVNYFTYRDKNNRAIFVAFDDERSIKNKLDLMAELEIQNVFFVYPEMKAFL